MNRTPPGKINPRLLQSIEEKISPIRMPNYPAPKEKIKIKDEDILNTPIEKKIKIPSNIKSMSSKTFGEKAVVLKDTEKEYKTVDFANKLGYDNDLLQSQKQILAITQPQEYLKQRQEELKKVKGVVNDRANKMYERYLSMQFPKERAKQEAEKYAASQLASEMMFLSVNYPQDLSELAKGKTYAKNIDIMRGDLQQ